MGGSKVKSSRKRLHDKTRKKWKKGHSSDSNPVGKKHRLAARNRFFNPPSAGPSSLTVEALSKHNEAQEDNDGDIELSETASLSQTAGGKTFASWASNWTECTNTTFSRVHRHWNSNSAQHKEILAVLAAVTEVIKTQGGQQTETEYFAALMTTLETVEGDQSLTAVAYLLSLAIKRVPTPVLKSRFSSVSKLLLETLGKHANTESSSLLRSLLVCLVSVLRAQEQSVWNASSTIHVYHGLLSFITHSKPRVRKSAHQAVTAVLKGSVFMVQGDPPPHHPAASTTAKYCIQQIEANSSGDTSISLHILELLKSILGVFPHHSLKSTCETILRLMTLNNTIMTNVAMKTLHGMFVAEPKLECLPVELNAQIITALYDFQPDENDVNQMAAWLAIMERGHINLARNDSKLCISHLPRLFTACMTCLQTDKTEIAQHASKTLKVLIKECLAPISDHLHTIVEMATPGTQTSVHRIFKSLEGGLSYQYHASWGLVLQVMATFFEALGWQCPKIMRKNLLSMANLRDSHKFPHKAELDYAVGVAVKVMGPKQVLEAISLQVDGENDDLDFPRSWLLPVLRENIQDTELAFFTVYFLPLAAKLRSKSIEYSKQNKVAEAKTYDSLQQQIWGLLPGFCNRTTDIKQSFMGIAKILGTAIQDRPDLRGDVMASLRKLINQNTSNEDNKVVLGRFAKNFLPILFNIFTADGEKEDDKSRQAILDTIKAYLQITESSLIFSFTDKCLAKLDESGVSAFRRYALMDILTAIVPYVKVDKLAKLFKVVANQLESADKTIQKKSYRVLEELCAGKSSNCKEFATSKLSDLQEHLLKSLSSSSASSKGPRLRCLCHIFKQLEESQPDFLQAVLPEAILCTKETNEKTRLSAYNLLIEMGNAVIRWSSDSKAVAVEEYVHMVMAGLAGDPHMVSTTILALTRILYQYKDDVTTNLLSKLMDTCCLLLKAKSREVVESTLGHVKVLLAIFEDTTLAQFLNKLVESLVGMKEDSRHHFRFKAKDIFARLCRKFGYQIIYNMVPESLHKMLVNIRKTQERAKKKQKNEQENKEDSDEEELSMKAQAESVDELLRDTDSELEEDDDAVKDERDKRKKLRKKKSDAWLKEEGEDDIVDFMDPGVVKKVTTTEPESSKSMKGSKTVVQHEFKMAPDGRFIITKQEEEKDKQASKLKSEDVDMDDLDELLEAMEGNPKKSRKRKLMTGDEDDPTSMKYLAGGSGIHRPVATEKHSRKDKIESYGSEFKSKKAGGDIKRKGAPDPYAYVPLQMKNLNKRKQAKIKGQFKSLVKGARKGAAKGNKMRKRKN